ncbi:unnamed protein product [Nesidiocoris tenuis]|uniref:SOSS complex subunit A homolog n=1 Tax=Nesidiocoris tenuis TaxID=355587 RepID=A0A6H5G4L8_9HEMI|nr:unnamed protein product [Nesidiocoris tenuis]CAA9997165.1 unnamed protein product [Nesidiocoris tenuis]
MDQAKFHAPRLYNTTFVENKKDEIEEKYERCYVSVQSLISGLSEKEVHDVLNNTLAKDKAHEESVCLGLLAAILTDPATCSKSYRDLTLVARDGLLCVQTNLSQLILERWVKLTDTVRAQVLWLVREMIKTGMNGVDPLCWNLMRHMAGGDVSPKNVFLIESVLDILTENRGWLEKFPLIIATSVYTFLRLIEDHNSPTLAHLQKKEIAFTVSLLRERFQDCLMIGRDLVRLLQNTARIPEIESVWRDIMVNPKSLSPTFPGVLSMLQTRTSRRFLQSRLTPDMEQKLVFLTSNVRFGNHKRFQEWFQRQYLGTPEAQSLRCDLIRFIVGVIHPTNELLCSDIIPRWAVIGWLLTTCTSNIASANAKLALFYDWLFYDPERDNIMNIEPAILVMYNSIKSHPAVTATLLDFLCRIIPRFYPSMVERVKAGVYTSLRQILDKRVLQTLQPLFDSTKLDRELRSMVYNTFPDFCFPPPIEGMTIWRGPPDIENQNGGQPEAVFSDEEADVIIKVEKDPPPKATKGSLTILQDDSLQNILTASLMWETFEQICLWQLVSAHNMPISIIIPVLTKLDFASHAEALSAILLMLQREKPTAELVKQVLSRDVGPHCDRFVMSVLLSWCREHENILAELIASLLSSRCPAVASPNKRKRTGTRASAAPSAERILGHLDRMRTGTKQFYKLDVMQKALHQAQSSCTEVQKSQFSNLFSLLEVEETTRGKGSGRGRRPANSVAKKKIAKELISDSTDDTSEDEEVVKPRQAKKRKKNLVNSDSD